MPHHDDEISQLIEELAVLRRSRGLLRSRLDGQVGPGLLRVLDLGDDASESDIRLALADALIVAARGLPHDMWVAFVCAFALKSSRRLLQERLEEAGQHIDRDARTVRRRLDEATEVVAERLVDGRAARTNHPLAPAGWTILRHRSELDLRAPQPVFVGEKVILVGQTLDTVTEAISLPLLPTDRGAEDLQITAPSGGEVVNVERPSASVWRYEVALGRTVRAGGTHTYQVRIQVPHLEWIAPYNGIVPFRSCTAFECIVHFAPDQLPERVQRLEGLPSGALGDPMDGPGLVPAEPTVRAEFAGLVPGLAYGLRWK